MIRNIRVTCSDKQRKQYQELITDYVDITYKRLDVQHTGDMHIDKIFSQALKDKAEEIGRLILDIQIGGYIK